MQVLWGLLSCCGLFVGFVTFVALKWKLEDRLRWRRLKQRAPAELQDERPPIPVELRSGRTERNWSGGYLDGGSDALRERALRLLRHGVVKQARVLEFKSSGDADEWTGHVAYAFHRLDGSIEVAQTYSSVDPRGAGLSRGVGNPEPAFDMNVNTGDWIHVLVDAETGEHLIYESLLVGYVYERPRPPPQQLVQVVAPPLPLYEASLPLFASTSTTLLHAASAADDDDTPRAVFGDLLSENDALRGELVALQLSATKDPAQSARIAELLRLNAAKWLPPGVDAHRYEFRRGFAHAVQLVGPTDVTHQEWRFIREVSWTANGSHAVPEQFGALTIHSLTGVSNYVLRELAKHRVPKDLRYVELTIPRVELPMHARELRALSSVETIGLRSRREEISAQQLAAMLDALPNTANVRVFNLWGDLRAFQAEIEQRPWLRALDLISLHTAVSSLSLELTATSMRLLRGGRLEPANWKGLTTALRAQGITTLPLFVAETGQTIDQSF